MNDVSCDDDGGVDAVGVAVVEQNSIMSSLLSLLQYEQIEQQ